MTKGDDDAASSAYSKQGVGAYAITSGHDWRPRPVTDAGGGYGRITTSGQITEFWIRTSLVTTVQKRGWDCETGNRRRTVGGGGGNPLWFQQASSNRRITTTGQVTYYSAA